MSTITVAHDAQHAALEIGGADACGLTEYVGAIALTRARRVDTARTRVRCAAHRITGCENVFLIDDGVSYIACLATTGGIGLGAFIIQCGEEQHHCCSAECALVAHAWCLLHHIRPAVDAVFAARQSGRITAAQVATAMLTPASADDADAARTIRQLATRGEATAKTARPAALRPPRSARARRPRP